MPSILEQFSPHALARGALATALILLVYTVVSRLFAHPLKAFPGPRLAALTDFYAAYYEVWKDGRFATHLKELHLIYGQFCLNAIRFAETKKVLSYESDQTRYANLSMTHHTYSFRFNSFILAHPRHTSRSTRHTLALPRIVTSIPASVYPSRALDSLMSRIPRKEEI